MLRVRDCEPPPHVLVQRVHTAHEPVTQLRAQTCALQARVSARCLHALPPKRGCVQVRLRLCEPLPHDLVQVVHEPQRLTVPSVGQECLLHARVSAECGHALPPKRGSTVRRVRLCEPEPHDLVHVVHRPKLKTLQLTGQA